MKIANRLLAFSLSTILTLLSPGLAPWAMAAEFSAPRANAGGNARIIVPVSPNLNGRPGALPGIPSIQTLGSIPQLPQSPVTTRDIVSEILLARTPLVPRTPTAGPSAEVRKISEGVSEILRSAGDISSAQPSSAYGAGAEIQDLLTGEKKASSLGDDGLTPASGGSAPGRYVFAKPAGDSIRQAAESYHGPSTPVPPSNGTGGSDGRGSGGNKGPFWPKLLSAAVALLPAALLGFPLIAAGSAVSGSLVIAASLGAAAFPFMSESTPRLVRSLPGAALVSLGLATLATTVSAFTWPAAVMGSLVALGGWGLMRFARNEDKWRHLGEDEALATFFGALGAAAGGGLVLLHPAGWIAAGLTYLSYPATLALLIHLPGWVGAAITAAFRGLVLTLRDAYAVLSSIRTDTVLRQRLVKYSEASMEQSAWNAVWLGLLVWLPIGVVEAVQAVIALSVGTVLGVTRAPLMALWGASHKLKADSWPTKLFASWARRQFAGSKAETFNRHEERLIPLANSESRLTRWAGALGIRVLQLGWVVYQAVRTPAVIAVGWLNADTDAPYDPKKHSPDYLRLAKDDLPGKVPDAPKPSRGMNPLPSKLLAAALGLAPLYLLGLPTLAAGGMIFAGLFAATALVVGVMPLMPTASWFPQFLRRAPGTLLSAAGMAALVTGVSLAMGPLAVLAGVGLKNLVDKLRDEDKKLYRTDDPTYIGGFVGALGVTAGLGAALSGLAMTHPAFFIAANVFAVVTSPLLLAHLPKGFWKGVWTAIRGIPSSIGKVGKVLHFWELETGFGRNLRSWFRYWIGKSVWNGGWLWLPWGLTQLVTLAEYALSAASGILLGALRAPTTFLWGWAYETNPDGRMARFWAGFHRFWIGAMEGSKASLFDPLVAKLLTAIGEKSPETGRPTLKAALALLAARGAQALWGAYLAVMVAATPLVLIAALVAGIRNASGPKAEPKDGSDPDRPGSLLD